jgi:hypothetical protein
MTNRFNVKKVIRHGQNPLSPGYAEDATAQFVIPSLGLEDIDTAIFSLFDKDIPIQVSTSEGNTSLKKVPVVFAGAEKWAMLKKNKPLRDKNNVLILPIITIARTNIAQANSEDIAGRAVNQKTGELLIRRKLDPRDRAYQNLINKNGISNQDGTIEGPGLLTQPITAKDGGYLLDTKNRNIFETIVIPTPQFITLTYDVIVWCQYTHHMNQIMETLFSSYLPQTQGWRLETPKGYWFVGQVEENSLSQENNVDDQTQERTIKQKFSVRVQSYILASSAPGVPIPVKKYISSPEISFASAMPEDPVITSGDYTEEPFLGSDDPTLPLKNERFSSRLDKRDVGDDILSGPDKDPGLIGYPRGKKPSLYKKTPQGRYVKVTGENRSSGETSYKSLGGLDDLIDTSFEE